ncbi:MAG: hypothetical protein AAFV33_18830, partial [Chloroflexota bacterium]
MDNRRKVTSNIFRVLMILFVSILFCPLTWGIGALVYFEFIPQWRIESTFRAYPNAEKLVDESGYWYDNIFTKVYFLTPDSMGEVQKYYEGFRPEFDIMSDFWSETSYSVANGERVDCDFNRAITVGYFDCATISLVSTDVDLATFTPVVGEARAAPIKLVNELQDLPANHTLIV